ncbi:helicase HerA domain-containing protein [Chloroflexus sp.]|uniref:helicase HerA domain-containing protein n=1 Tax=Chloroflexus sp. TaxID=1904827 RepID=UPI002624449C|nr:DUF87 domain-containing protein [uncultured Chloroflexus sp.]
MQQRQRLGVVTGGSLLEGLTVRLDAGTSVEDVRVGKFVVVKGQRLTFFSMVTDVRLGMATPKVMLDPPPADEFFASVLTGTTTYGELRLDLRLMLPHDGSAELLPVKTVPHHFAPLFEASDDDFRQVFGQEEGSRFMIGTPLDMNVPVCIDLNRLVERSNGVFGKSGTGKSFLTRLLVCGVILSDVASNLIFDMHNEYGWSARSEGARFVKGLRQLFGSKVLIYTLAGSDGEPIRANERTSDGTIVIGYDQIEPEDVLLLSEELNLNPTAAETAELLVDSFGQHWLARLWSMDSEDLRAFADEKSASIASLNALKRKTLQLKRLGFVREQADISAVDHLINALMAGRHVVLSFGRYDDPLAYMLVANILTRRIHQRWREQTERYLLNKNEADRPRPLMITIEEAHKFLNPRLARQTIFGTIAREMRKYSVTLLVVDQRPSSIDSEVLSQLGTRITALLSDEQDIDAVFTGVGGSARLRTVLANLDTRQQALVLGHAVPMPVVVQTRPYDETFYCFIEQRIRRASDMETAQKEADELFPD